MLRAIFMGTPEFAVPSLLALTEVADVSVVGVVTRLDKPIGRSRTPEAPPVKVAALAHGLPVLQPGSLRKPAAQQVLADLAPDIIIVAAFGQILPAAILDLPRYGCLNVHASLLPRYRGASPIAAAILAGDAATGNTIMRMDVGLDTGDIIAQATLPIAPDDTTASLTAKLATQGANLLARTLPDWVAGSIQATPQDAALATTTSLIRKEDGRIDWALASSIIARQVRAFTPWPGSQTTWNGQPLKIIAAHPLTDDDHLPPDLALMATHGSIIAWGRGAAQRVAVRCGKQSALVLDVLQLPGKRATNAADVVRGQPTLVGAHLPS